MDDDAQLPNATEELQAFIADNFDDNTVKK